MACESRDAGVGVKIAQGKSRSKKHWLFKKGVSNYDRRECKLETNVPKRLFKRLPNDLYVAAKGASVGKILPTILRSGIKVTDHNIGTGAQSLCESNTQLTDNSSTSGGYFSIESGSFPCMSMQSAGRKNPNVVPVLEGNRIISMSRLTETMNFVYHTHSDKSEHCRGNFIFPDYADRNMTQYGMGTVLTVQCTLCNFKDTFKMFEELTRNDSGRPAAKINRQLAVFMTKSAISYNDVRLLFSSLEIPPISETALINQVNYVSPKWKEINERMMDDNTQILKILKQHKEESSNGVLCMTDTCYNNPPKGRSMYQPGTQCVTPMLECETSKNMVIALTSMSKLCKKGPRCNLLHSGCTATMPVETPISSAEKNALIDNVKQVEMRGLTVEEVVCDGTATKQLDALNIKKQHCLVHMARCQKRRVIKAQLSNRMVGSSNKKIHMRFKQKLSRAISCRCTMELATARQLHETNDEDFLSATSKAKDNILNCFSGDHSTCKESSLICAGRGKADSFPKYLPHNRAIEMNRSDRAALQAAIDYRLSRDASYKQRKLQTTNKVEAMHLSCLKLNPKMKTYKRNFSYRNHSAIHSNAIGSSKSILSLMSKLNVYPKSFSGLKSLQNKARYHAARQKTVRFAQRRRILSLEKNKFKEIMQSMAPHSSNTTPDEHSYA